MNILHIDNVNTECSIGVNIKENSNERLKQKKNNYSMRVKCMNSTFVFSFKLL